MYPPPVLLGLTLCKEVVVEEGTRNLTLVNVFTRLAAKEIPISLPFVLFAPITNAKGDATIKVIAQQTDNLTECFSHSWRAHFPDRLMEIRLLLRVHNCVFPVFGQYAFALLVDGETIGQRKVRIIPKEDLP